MLGKDAINTRFFIGKTFFNSASVLLIFFVNWASNVAWAFLYTCNHHYTETYILYLRVFILVFMCPCLNLGIYVMHCAFWYHLYNLKNMKNTHAGVLLLVKLKAGTKSRKTSHSYLCDLLFIFNLIFIVIDHKTSLTCFLYFFRISHFIFGW